MRRMSLCLILLLCALLLSACGAASAPEPTPEPTPCPHEAWQDGLCLNCGFACPHETWQDGVCPVCGYVCRHETWQDGVCTVCGTVCPHEMHDPETLRCTQCGEWVYHSYESGVCRVCGAEALSCSGPLPDRFYEECEHAGKIQSLSYTNAEPGWATYTRHITLYTPYGYDPTVPYDVMILLHGTGDNETSWLTQDHYVAGNMIQVRTVFDRMIDEHLIRPMIILSVGLYEDFGTYVGNPTDERLARELREIILPYVAENYPTFAENSSLDAIRAARRHFGLGGLSWGSVFTYASGMRRNADLFGNFICLSGNDSPEMVVEAVNSPEMADLPIYLYYSASGTTDMAHAGGINNFRFLVTYSDRLVEGQNAFLHETVGGHDWTVWSTEIFNALQLCFPEP